jgi:hypothetical protein
MKTRILPAALLIAGTVAVVTAPAAAQSLQQRVAAVRAKQEKKETQGRQKMLQTLLYRDLTVDFTEAPAKDVFDFFRTALDLNIVVRYSNDAVGFGIDPEQPITLEAQKTPALVVLELVLEQCSVIDDCTWQLRKGFLEVGTKQRLSVPAARVLRWVPIDELVFEAPHFEDALDLRLDHAFPTYGGGGHGYTGGGLGGFFGGFGGGGGGGYGGSIQYSTNSSGDGKTQRVQSLITLITDLVEPTAWTHNGGDQATIRYRDGVLIIQAPQYIQRQIFGYPKVPAPE